MFDPATSALETKLVLAPDTVIPADQEVELIAARPIIARRLDKLALDGPYNVAIRNGQLEITLPKDENIPYIASIITSVGEIVFIDGGLGTPPVGQEINLGIQSQPGYQTFQILFTSREVSQIDPPNPQTGQIFYRLVLQPAAADRFGDFTATRPGSYVCMVLDVQVINCSLMYHQTGEAIEILPELSSSSGINMDDLAVFLYSGPLKTRLRVVAE
jgi:hypothetical protein